MKIFRMLLVLFFLLEVGGLYFLQPHSIVVTPAMLPDIELADPLAMPDLKQLAVKAEQGTAADWRVFAEATLGKGFYAYSEHAFRNALQYEPENMWCRFGLAFCLDRTGRMQASNIEYEKILELPATNDQEKLLKHYALFGMGRNALRMENAELAEQCFQSDISFPPAAYQLAKLWIRQDKTDDALPLIAEMLARIPYSLEFHYLNYRAALATGDEVSAQLAEAMVDRSAYLVSMNFGTEYVTPLTLKTGLAGQLSPIYESKSSNDWPQLEAQVNALTKKVAGLIPFEVFEVYYLQLDALLKQEKWEQAEQRIQQLQQLGIDNARLADGLAQIRAAAGDLSAAIRDWERAVLLSPDQEYYQQLATAYKQQNQPELAKKSQAMTTFYQGIAAYRSNNLESALLFLQQAVTEDASLAEAFYYQGEMQFHLERPDAAQSAYEKCLKLRPQHGRAAAKQILLQKLPNK